MGEGGGVVRVSDRTPAERALARSFTTGDGRTGFTVDELSADHRPDRSVVLTYRLIVAHRGRESERWEWTLVWDDRSFADVFTASAPEPRRLEQLVFLVRALLEEWWDTKGANRGSAKMGRRLS